MATLFLLMIFFGFVLPFIGVAIASKPKNKAPIKVYRTQHLGTFNWKEN